MLNEVSQSCAICSQHPQDMLILSCNHHLCLDCATQLFTASSNHHQLQCQICLATTPLDHDTITCLQGLAATHYEPEAQQPIQVHVPRPPKIKKQGFSCSLHKQKAIYYCFDCRDGSICSECILEGAHGGHGVMTIKKASRILTDKIVEYSKCLEKHSKQLTHKANSLQQIRQSLSNEHQQKSTQLRLLFEVKHRSMQSLVKQVTDRYNDLNSELEHTARRSMQMVEGNINEIRGEVERIRREVQQNRVAVERQQESMILRRYAQMEHNKQLLECTDAPVSNIKDILLANESSCNSDLETVLSRISWTSKHASKENQQNQLNLSLDNTLHGVSPNNKTFHNPYINEPDSILVDRECSGVNKYSGIKSSSRRSELNRSMNNATNIINRLQQRVRR